MKVFSRYINTLIIFSFIYTLTGTRPVNASPSASVISFSTGSLIIPMDTNSQNNGMLRAYGLVYELLRNNIPVYWAIDTIKSTNGNDFTINAGATVQSVRTGAMIALPHSYRGGPFIIEATDATLAQPIITAWQATTGDSTEVHKLIAGLFSVNITRILINAPRIAILKDGFEQTAFNNLNAAGIPDSAGGAWNSSSPDLLTESQVVGTTTTDDTDGILHFEPNGLARYCFLASMHYSSTTQTSEVVAETRAWLDGNSSVHAFMQCESARVFENSVSGLFLTNAGLDDDGSATNSPAIRVPSSPLAQMDGTFEVDSGAVDSIKANAAPGGTPDYKTGVTTIINEGSSALTQRIVLMAGRLDGDTANGQVTYLAGHDYSIALPITSNPQTNGVRLFLNSIFTSDCAINPSQPNLTLTLSAPSVINNNEITYTINYSNPGPRPNELVKITDTLPAGVTYINGSASVSPTSVLGNTLTWSVPPLAAGENRSLTFRVSVTTDGTYENMVRAQFAHLTVHNVTSNTVTTQRDTISQPPTVISHTLQSSYVGLGQSSFTVTFSKDVSNAGSGASIDDVTNVNNFKIINKGTNGNIETASCAVSPPGGDDSLILPSGVTYINPTAIVNLGSALPPGSYRLFVCGTTSIVDLVGNALAGDGVTSGTDFTFDFTVVPSTTNNTTNNIGIAASSLPKTGFAPNKVSTLPAQPATLEYSNLGDLWLEIPSLNVKSTIVGVPQNVDKTWDVSWLGNDTGWLNGTAFPTWNGNSVLTAHVTNASGLAGPFAALKSLKYGDQIIVHFGGVKYIYEVRVTKLVRPYTTNFTFESKQDASYLTLVTCSGYNPLNESYLFRRVVRAVLVSTASE